jgi:hypothetical protein
MAVECSNIVLLQSNSILVFTIEDAKTRFNIFGCECDRSKLKYIFDFASANSLRIFKRLFSNFLIIYRRIVLSVYTRTLLRAEQM